jgi:hypothetical protein
MNNTKSGVKRAFHLFLLVYLVLHQSKEESHTQDIVVLPPAHARA